MSIEQLVAGSSLNTAGPGGPQVLLPRGQLSLADLADDSRWAMKVPSNVGHPTDCVPALLACCLLSAVMRLHADCMQLTT